MVAWFKVSVHTKAFISSLSPSILSGNFPFVFLEFHQSRSLVHDCTATEMKKKKTGGVKQNTWNLHETSKWKNENQYFNGKTLVGVDWTGLVPDVIWYFEFIWQIGSIIPWVFLRPWPCVALFSRTRSTSVGSAGWSRYSESSWTLTTCLNEEFHVFRSEDRPKSRLLWRDNAFFLHVFLFHM